jgi:hypothetical protein
MAKKIIESCPKAIWAQRNINPPIWQQVYHMLYGVDYWFSETKESFQPPAFNEDVISVLGEESAGFIDQNDMLGYLDYVSKKVEKFIGGLDEIKIIQASVLYNKWTNLDVIIEQVRHVQHHLGYLNRVLLKCKIKPVEWELYEE